MSEDFSNNTYNKNLRDYARKLRNNSTLAEVILWDEVLKQKQLKGYSFLRQRPIGKYIVDFFCKELKLTIELDGTIHRFQKNKDKKREDNLREMGYHIIRFHNEEILKSIYNVKISLELYIQDLEKIKNNVTP